MAGAGSRFIQAGYQIPKPFIPIRGKAMIEHVIDNITLPEDKVYLLCRLEHLDYLSQTRLPERDNLAFIPITRPTEGAACTVLKARQFINNEEPLIIANSDQYVSYNQKAWREQIITTEGAIMTFYSQDPKWSYAVIDLWGAVRAVAEKEVVSKHATVGVYGFRQGQTFVEGADSMIAQDIRTNGEFYVCPVFNEIVPTKAVHNFPVEGMYGMGTPEDLEKNYKKIGA
jgi:NDP-sugar pyrophosphorylase family protein